MSAKEATACFCRCALASSAALLRLRLRPPPKDGMPSKPGSPSLRPPKADMKPGTPRKPGSPPVVSRKSAGASRPRVVGFGVAKATMAGDSTALDLNMKSSSPLPQRLRYRGGADAQIRSAAVGAV